MKPGPYLIWGLLGAAAIVAAAISLSRSTSATSGVFADESQFQTSAILSGRNHNYAIDAFVAGNVNAFMGGAQLDFRGSTIEGDMAVVDMFVMMGGVEIRIPSGWIVVNDLNLLMGGIEDNTVVQETEGAKRLVLQGTLIMGGVSIKN